MANVKNFGLIGVGSELQFGKASSKLINNAGNFNFRAADGTTPVAISTAGITSSAGGVTLTTGNVTLSSTAGTISIGGDVTLQRQGAGVLQLSGDKALMLPVGNDTERPTGAVGMIRVNDESSPVVEYWDGTQWTDLGGAGSIAALQTEVDNIETSLGAMVNGSGEFQASAFSGFGNVSSPTSLTNVLSQLDSAISANDTLDEILPGTDGQVIYNDAGTWAVALPGSTSGVQAWDAGLDALAAKSDTGILVQSGADTYVSRSLTAPAAGITISNADGVSGNPTFALANDLAALEGLTTNGMIVRTGDGTAATRTITGTSGRISVTAGDGVAGDPTIDLATVTDTGAGTFLKVTVDSYGRVTGTQAVVAGDIEGLVDGTYVNVDGDTMAGNLDFNGTFKVTGLAEPTAASDAATKNYVDNAVTGLSWKQAVHVLADSNVDVATGGLLTIDGHTLQAGERVLLINQTTASEEGIWVAASGAWSRAADADTYQELNGAAVFVQQGTVYADTGWTQTATLTSFSGQNWAQFSGAGSYSAGDGLLLTGTVFSVNMGAGITTLPSDEVGIDVEANKAVQLTSALTGGQLTLVLDSGSGLEQSSSGLKISTAGVTNAMLANSGFPLTADTGSETLSLGQTLHIQGVSTQGTSVTVGLDGAIREYTVTVADASSSQKGVASFTTTEFVVTSGNVALGLVGVTKGGTGLSTAAVGDLLVGNGTNSYGALAIGTTGQYLRSNGTTAAWAALSASDITGTLGVANGGTGATTFTDTAILIGDGTNPIEATSALTYNSGTDVLTIGGATGVSVTAAGGDVTIASLDTNADIILSPNGTGQVVIGPAGDGVISADAGQTLTITGNDTLVLQSTSGDIVMTVPSGTGTKVTVSGPTAADYATSLANEDLVNKYYVDQAITNGASSGAVKVVKATVSLASAGSTNIGAALPAGASILRVKVQVTAADTGTGTLQVGKAGGSEYMTTSENDTQTIGLYLAETYVVEAGSVQVQATVAGSPAGSGSAVVIVEYQVA